MENTAQHFWLLALSKLIRNQDMQQWQKSCTYIKYNAALKLQASGKTINLKAKPDLNLIVAVLNPGLPSILLKATNLSGW